MQEDFQVAFNTGGAKNLGIPEAGILPTLFSQLDGWRPGLR